MKNAFAKPAASNAARTKYKGNSPSGALADQSLFARARGSAVGSPSKAPSHSAKSEAEPQPRDHSKHILDRLIPLLRYLKDESGKQKPAAAAHPGHKKSFSVSQQKFREYCGGRKAERSVAHSKKASVERTAECPTLDELLAQKDGAPVPYSYLSLGQSLACNSQEESTLSGGVQRSTHVRTASDHKMVSRKSPSAVSAAAKVHAKAGGIEELYRAQARLLNEIQREVRSGGSKERSRRASFWPTVPTTSATRRSKRRLR